MHLNEGVNPVLENLIKNLREKRSAKKPAGNLVTVLLPVLLAAGTYGNVAMAQEQATATSAKEETTVLAENEQFQVIEERFGPGAESDNVARPPRVVRAVKGGTLQRIFPEGKTDVSEWKTDEVRMAGATPPYITKNVGSTDIVLYTVRLK
jgi:hypothetical protein